MAADSIRLRADDVTWRLVDGQVILLDRRTWGYVTINSTGAELWDQVVEGTSRRRLVAALTDAYRIDDKRAGEDVDRFLATLREHALLAETG